MDKHLCMRCGKYVDVKVGKPEVSDRGEYTFIICKVCNDILARGYKARAVNNPVDSVDK